MSENVELMQGIEFPELPETVEAEKVDYNELNNLIKYYERKIKLIRDLIDIETGGEM